MYERFSNSINEFERYFYSYASTLSWMVFMPYVVYTGGVGTSWAVLFAVIGYLFIRVKFGYLFQASFDFKSESSSSIYRHLTVLRSFAVRAYLLAMLFLPAVFLMPVATLASQVLLGYGLRLPPPIIATIVITLVFALSSISISILGLITRIISVPIVSITLFLLTAMLLAWFTRTSSVFVVISNTPFDWPTVITWFVFVYYVLCAGLLTGNLQPNKLTNKSFLPQLFPALAKFIFPLLLVIFLPTLAYFLALPTPEEVLPIATEAYRDFSVTQYQSGTPNYSLSLIFVSAAIFLAQIFTLLPEYMVQHSQAGSVARFETDSAGRIFPVVLARTIVFLTVVISCFFDHSFLVAIGGVLVLLSSVFHLFTLFLRSRQTSAGRFIKGVSFGLFLLFLLSFSSNQHFLILFLAFFAILATYAGDKAFLFFQRFLLQLIKFFLSISAKIKRDRNLTINQLVKTQTLIVFWVVLVFAISEAMFAVYIEEVLANHTRGSLIDLALLLILLLYYLTIIINSFLIVPKVRHYTEIQLNLEKSNQRLAADLTERKRMEKKLRYTSSHDSLTQVYTRDYLLDRLKKYLQKKNFFSIVFIDIDRFKKVNDLYGHLVGDRLLQDIAKYLQKKFNRNTVIARFGGDEFFLIVNGEAEQDIIDKCQEIVTHFRLHYLQEDLEIATFLRVGIYHYRGEKVSVANIVRDIDFTIRYAKSQTNTTYTVYNHEIEEIYQKRILLEEDMEERIKNRDFYAYYQPIYNQQQSTVVGFEQLLRIDYEGRYQLPPTYIEIAEETGNIQEIGWIMLEQACVKQYQLVKAGYPEVYVGVNISPSQFIQTDFVSRLKKLCFKHNVRPSCLRLEIVENVMLGGNAEVRQIMNELTWSGFSLYLDDFGTGFSNMGYLKRLPIDTIKIDQSFIRTQDAAGQAVVRAIVSLARELSLNVIAEGVEEKKHQEFLRSLGVRFLQGYLISKPMPAEEVLSFLRSFKN